VKFSTYAVPVILGEMKRLFREGGTVKVGRSLKELSLKAARESEKFLSEKGRVPQINELSEILGVDPEQAALALCASMPVISLTNGSDDDNEGKQGDIPVNAPEENISEKLALQQVLDKLPLGDKNLIILRYFKHKTQTDTALMLGMSQVQVSRKEKKILAFMRSELI
jgi:RNA polymerase sporulation-specific sigma factor